MRLDNVCFMCASERIRSSLLLSTSRSGLCVEPLPCGTPCYQATAEPVDDLTHLNKGLIIEVRLRERGSKHLKQKKSP